MVFKSTLTWQREERIAAEAKAAEEAKKKLEAAGAKVELK